MPTEVRRLYQGGERPQVPDDETSSFVAITLNELVARTLTIEQSRVEVGVMPRPKEIGKVALRDKVEIPYVRIPEIMPGIGEVTKMSWYGFN